MVSAASTRRRSFSPYPSVKRLLDVSVSAVGLAVASPILVLVAAAVAFTMGRPVLFRQVRPGLGGAQFTVAKFRTMRSGSGSDAERLTRLGRFLRASSLDELPQLWNVLRGDMSLVGPRPLLPEYMDLYSERQARRHEVRPGITGLAQVNGRNTLGWDDRLELDVVYVESRSARLDLKILGMTIAKVTKRAGISADGEATMPHFTGSSKSTSGVV